MAPQRTAADDVSARQVNSILRNLRGEHFRHTQNALGRPASASSLSSYAHNQPTLPLDLIYPAKAPAGSSHAWVPGPSPPRSWRPPSSPSEATGSDINDTQTWRERALSLVFSPDVTSSPRSNALRPIYPDPGPIPQLTLLCLQLIRATCSGPDLADVIPFIPRHLRRALVRYAAVHAPLSQTELDALCSGDSHVDTELVVVGPHNTLRARTLRRDAAPATADYTDTARLGGLAPRAGTGTDAVGTESDMRGGVVVEPAWDAIQSQGDGEPLTLRSLVVLSSPLSVTTLLAFPPTITRLALIRIPHPVPLPRLPMICPLVTLLDVSYNAWLHDVGPRGPPMLEEVEWGKLRRLEVLGLRECPVTPKLLLELNRGRWEDVRIIRWDGIC